MRKKPFFLGLSLLGLALGSCDPALPSSSSSSPGSSSETSKVETSSSDSEPVSVVSNELISESDGVRTYKIVFSDGTETVYSVKDGADGAKGPDGTYIVEVKKTGSEGNVDTYTIYLTNGTTFTFTVTDGAVSPVDKATVSFDANGGKAAIDSLVVEKGDAIELPLPSRQGYSFLGWYDDARASANVYTNATPIISDLTLVARWEPNYEDWDYDQAHFFVELQNSFSAYYISQGQIVENSARFASFLDKMEFASNNLECQAIADEFHAWLEALPSDEEGKASALAFFASFFSKIEENSELTAIYAERIDVLVSNLNEATTIGELKAACEALGAASRAIDKLIDANLTFDAGRSFYDALKEAFASLLNTYADLPLQFDLSETFSGIERVLDFGDFEAGRVIDSLHNEFERSVYSLADFAQNLGNYLCDFLQRYAIAEVPETEEIIMPFLEQYRDVHCSSLEQLQAHINGLTEEFPSVLAEVEQAVGDYRDSQKTVTISSSYPFAPSYGYSIDLTLGPDETADVFEFAPEFPGYQARGLYLDPDLTQAYKEGEMTIDQTAPSILYVGYDLVSEDDAYSSVKNFGYDYFPPLADNGLIEPTVDSYYGQGVSAACDGLFQAAMENVSILESSFNKFYDVFLEESLNCPYIDASAKLAEFQGYIEELRLYYDPDSSDLDSFKQLYASLLLTINELEALFHSEGDSSIQKEELIRNFEEQWGYAVNDNGCDLSGHFQSLHDLLLLCYQKAPGEWAIGELEMIAKDLFEKITYNAISYRNAFDSFISTVSVAVNDLYSEGYLDPSWSTALLESLEGKKESGTFTPEEMLLAFFEASESLLVYYEEEILPCSAGFVIGVSRVFPSKAISLLSGMSTAIGLPAEGDLADFPEYAIPGFRISGIYVDPLLSEQISDDSTYELGDLGSTSAIYLSYELVDYEAAVPYLREFVVSTFASDIFDGVVAPEEIDEMVAVIDAIDSHEDCLAALESLDSFLVSVIGRMLVIQYRGYVKEAAYDFGYSVDEDELEGYLSRVEESTTVEEIYQAMIDFLSWIYGIYPSM